MFRELYQETILEHGQSPRNFRKMKGRAKSAEGFNPVCGDSCRIYLKSVKDRIKDLSFEGRGCLIFMASASLMTTVLKGKTMKEVNEYFKFFRQLTRNGKPQSKMGAEKLIVFSGISKFPLRVDCALLPWQTAMSLALHRY